MKRLGAILGILLTSSTVLAGSYDFECTGFHIDKETNQIYKMKMTRDSATLDSYPGLKLEILDPNVGLFNGEQSYADAKGNVTVQATVTPVKQIIDLNGNIGPREHEVEINSVQIKVVYRGSVKTFVGTCTETTITTCGGLCY